MATRVQPGEVQLSVAEVTIEGGAIEATVVGVEPADTPLLAKLRELTAAKDAGFLSGAEFADAKQSVLASLGYGGGGGGGGGGGAVGENTEAGDVGAFEEELKSLEWSGGKPGDGTEGHGLAPGGSTGTKPS